MKYFGAALFVTATIMIMIPTSTTGQFNYVSKQQLANKLFENYPEYTGKDLGIQFSENKCSFKVWSPASQKVRILLYEQGSGGKPVKVKNMKRGSEGVWSVTLKGKLEGKYYAFQIYADSVGVADFTAISSKQKKSKSSRSFWHKETPDPYAFAVGVNGERAMIVDFNKTNPEGWNVYKRPALRSFSDIILYELHIRDLSVHPSSGIQHKGKYLGLTEKGTKTPGGNSTGLDHISELGVTHVHLLPVYDFLSIDEKALEKNRFNWGYDPLNYSAPEGSYSTNPEDGRVRIREFKEMVKALHESGLRVIMDVVYNHTGSTENSVFNRMAPYYYYRLNEKGGWSDASACGNETASERPMMRKYMIESMLHWAKEYHVDGFRVDLMGIHDIETMNVVAAELQKYDPSLFIYGEGWTAGGSPLPDDKRAIKSNTLRLKGIAAFSDELRDGVKGHVFTPNARGFATGEKNLEESVKFGIVGAIQHPQVDNKAVNYSKAPWANQPIQCINYVSCHDNHSLYDRLVNSVPGITEPEIVKLIKFTQTIVLTSQGIPFLHAGEEITRTKFGVENSFESGDEINQIVWSNKDNHMDLYNYHKDLISLRKNHPAFRMGDADAVRKNLEFLDTKQENTIMYLLKDNANGDTWKRILLVFNGSDKSQEVAIPAGNWKAVCRDGKINEAGLGVITSNRVSVSSRSALILAE